MDAVTLAATAVTFLSSCLVKAGEKAAEKVGEKLPDVAGKMWNAIAARFKDRPAAKEAVKDLVARPEDQDNQAAFRKELRKALESERTFAAEFEQLLDRVQRESGDTIINRGTGAVATRDSVAAGAGGVAVKGDVHGNITLGGSEKPK